MNLFPSHIKLNGQLTAVNQLIKNSEEKTEWEKECLNFLSEWYNTNNWIKVNTSGSTGTPKTIRLKKTFIADSAKRTLLYFNLKENDRVLHCLPTHYIAGKLMLVRALIGKLDLQLVDPSSDFSFLKTEHYQFAAMVPNQILKILNSPLHIGTENLKQLLIGGAAVSQLLGNKLQHVTTACYSSYGMTETATHIALQKINGKETDGFYHCMDAIQVNLSADNCLQIIMPGIDNQLLQTTDLAELKDNKTFRILGRADHVIISGGIKFSPELLEKKLNKYITQSFLISSLPHDKLGQQLVLFIEGTENTNTRDKIQSACQQALTKHECPRQILFIPKLPRTPNGKLKRKALTKL